MIVFIQNNLSSILTGFALLLVISLAVLSHIRSRRKGTGCAAGACATCAGCPSARPQAANTPS